MLLLVDLGEQGDFERLKNLPQTEIAGESGVKITNKVGNWTKCSKHDEKMPKKTLKSAEKGYIWKLMRR